MYAGAVLDPAAIADPVGSASAAATARDPRILRRVAFSMSTDPLSRPSRGARDSIRAHSRPDRAGSVSPLAQRTVLATGSGRRAGGTHPPRSPATLSCAECASRLRTRPVGFPQRAVHRRTGSGRLGAVVLVEVSRRAASAIPIEWCTRLGTLLSGPADWRRLVGANPLAPRPRRADCHCPIGPALGFGQTRARIHTAAPWSPRRPWTGLRQVVLDGRARQADAVGGRLSDPATPALVRRRRPHGRSSVAVNRSSS